MQQGFPLTSVVVQTNTITGAAFPVTSGRKYLRAKTYRPVHAECNGNLKCVRNAKQRWARDYGRTSGDMPTREELSPYYQDGTEPHCPAGGVYTLGSTHENPQCSLPGHVLEEPVILVY